MEVKIENMVFGWHEELPKMFLELLNTLVLTKNEQDVRGVMEVFARKELFNILFAFGYGAHHLWVTQKKASDPDQCLENRLRTPFMGDAEKGIRPRPMFGEQITDC